MQTSCWTWNLFIRKSQWCSQIVCFNKRRRLSKTRFSVLNLTGKKWEKKIKKIKREQTTIELVHKCAKRLCTIQKWTTTHNGAIESSLMIKELVWYLPLNELLHIFDCSHTTFACNLVNIFLSPTSHLLINYFLRLTYGFRWTYLAAYSKFRKVRARRP